MAKASAAVYRDLKRKRWFSIKNEMVTVNIFMMAAIYYVYSEHP